MFVNVFITNGFQKVIKRMTIWLAVRAEAPRVDHPRTLLHPCLSLFRIASRCYDVLKDVTVFSSDDLYQPSFHCVHDINVIIALYFHGLLR